MWRFRPWTFLPASSSLGPLFPSSSPTGCPGRRHWARVHGPRLGELRRAGHRGRTPRCPPAVSGGSGTRPRSRVGSHAAAGATNTLLWLGRRWRSGSFLGRPVRPSFAADRPPRIFCRCASVRSVGYGAGAMCAARRMQRATFSTPSQIRRVCANGKMSASVACGRSGRIFRGRARAVPSFRRVGSGAVAESRAARFVRRVAPRAAAGRAPDSPPSGNIARCGPVR